jgi:hypothetical protein
MTDIKNNNHSYINKNIDRYLKYLEKMQNDNNYLINKIK